MCKLGDFLKFDMTYFLFNNRSVLSALWSGIKLKSFNKFRSPTLFLIPNLLYILTICLFIVGFVYPAASSWIIADSFFVIL